MPEIQGTLFGLTGAVNAYLAPLAGSADPASSHVAARRMKRSGKQNAHCEIVLAIIRRCPRSTYGELWAKANAEERDELKTEAGLQKRLGDLINAGRIKRLAMRLCTVHRTQAGPVAAVE